MDAAVKTFIRVVEVWVPDREQSLLEFGGGLYGHAKRLGLVSRSMCFGRGEGLPGRAWDEGRPIVLKQLDPSLFRRSEQARADGLTCGIALPIFSGDTLNAVLVMFCGDDAQHAGAIELWRNDPAESNDLTLDDGYYGNTADAFEFISRRTSFRKGIGLPGMAWQAGLPVFLPDLGKSGRFLRADSAVKVGINRGFAMPCSTPGDEHYVMAFLSALATPIAQRVEIWVPDATGGRLRRSTGFSEAEGPLGPLGDRVARGEGPIGRAFESGVPAVVEPSAGGLSLAAIPVVQQGRLAAVLALGF